MTIYLLVPLLLGALAVFQPILNRLMLDLRGQSFVAWLNSLVLFTVASLTLLAIYTNSEKFPEYLRPKFNGEWRWWYVLPGLMGFLVVFNLPLAIRSFGSFSTILALILGQLLTSLVYDAYTSGQLPGLSRILGLVFALAGVYLSFRPSN